MRPIKFRAWDKEYNVMCDSFELKQYISYSEFGQKQLVPNTISNIELMQFTGLLDKNGKEIFESDIIFERGQNREVIFHKGCFCVRHFEVEDYPLDRDTYHIFSHEHIEVIGNIYENPELLTK